MFMFCRSSDKSSFVNSWESCFVVSDGGKLMKKVKSQNHNDDVVNRRDDHLGTAAPAPRPTPAPVPRPTPAPVVVPKPAPAQRPTPVPVLLPASAPNAQPVRTTVPSHAPRPVPVPAHIPAPAPSSMPAPVPTPTPRPTPAHIVKPKPAPKAKPASTPKVASVVGPDHVLESNKLITSKYLLPEDSILLRDEECPICFEGYCGENPKITTTCSHHYHLGCIYDWQERSNLCPTCLKVMKFEEMK